MIFLKIKFTASDIAEMFSGESSSGIPSNWNIPDYPQSEDMFASPKMPESVDMFASGNFIFSFVCFHFQTGILCAKSGRMCNQAQAPG